MPLHTPPTAHCLNCGTPLKGRFCHQCGQRASTRRFTLKRLFSWDFLDDHLDLSQGLPLTLKNLLSRPGGLIHDYLTGQRRKYFNFIGLLLLLLAAEALLMAVAIHPISDVTAAAIRQQFTEDSLTPEQYEQIGEGVQLMFSSQKFVYLLVVPLTALFLRLLFRRTNYTIAEHMVALVFVLSVNTLLGLLLALPGLFPIGEKNFALYYQLYSIPTFIMYYVAIRGYTKRAEPRRRPHIDEEDHDATIAAMAASAGVYTALGGIWRAVVGTLIFIIFLSLGLQLTAGLWVGYKAKQVKQTESIELPVQE